ncbi:MAG: hypothetical protein ACREKE_01215 [bacterium]
MVRALSLTAGLVLVSALCFGVTAGPVVTGTPGPGLNLAQTLADAVNAGKGPIEGILGSLDGGPLTEALRKAARLGRPLRLVMDSDDAQSRSVGRNLAALGARLRWSPDLRSRHRDLDVAGVGAWTWASGSSFPAVLKPGLAIVRFSSVWDESKTALPPALVLRDELEALPDPREETPRYTRRAAGASAP